MQIRPALYTVPDRAKWEAEHGVKPVEIETEAQFVDEAMDWLREDLATIDAERAEAIGDALDSLCETIGIIEGIDPDTAIFFDRHARKFVAFPKTP